ncbi:MAG: HAD family hydrolase [Gammaproteobacteria bacterium]|nr:HAD family hydrolase [Gammaproteobacteria bacterium]
MHPSFELYDTIIFDCDGVILDSNNLKVQAMRESLSLTNVDCQEIEQCCAYFKGNFGKSRFHHIQYFIENIISKMDKNLYENVLGHYSMRCEALYLTANLTPGFIQVIEDCSAKLYIASGSAQEELRQVFKHRNLKQYFEDIFGSPVAKSENVAKILQQSSGRAVMIGDSLSDYEAANENAIDFIGFIPFSNEKKKLESLAQSEGFTLLRSW